MIDKFLKVAYSQVGYLEKKSNKDLDSKTANSGNGNYTKYGAWYGVNPGAWCGMFVSWCANQVGILNKLVPKFAKVGNGYKWFRDKGKLTMNPRRGDIGFLKPTKSTTLASHTFIVYEVNGNEITTIEGNLNNRVMINHRNLKDNDILAFGKVDDSTSVVRYVDNVDYEGLNVRYAKNDKATGQVLPIGTKVDVIKFANGKAYLTSDTYVFEAYLSKECPDYKVVKGADKDGLAVRSKPSVLGKKITTIKNGTRVKVYKTKGKWSKISPNTEAWSYSKYLK